MFIFSRDTADGVNGSVTGNMYAVSIIRYIGSVLLCPLSTTALMTDDGTRASYSFAGVYIDKIF